MRGSDDTILHDLARLLERCGGRFLFTVDGREYAVAALDDMPETVREQQRVLPMRQRDERNPPSSLTRRQELQEGSFNESAHEVDEADAAVLARINRDIALYRDQADDEFAAAGAALEAVQLLDTAAEEGALPEQLRRVRFEPLKGDLPPELQE
ncbi:MAG: hypothetical protein COT71_03295 [Candidatus Andersenbacteria bacterium CG10_big_fil_rev_8_21_14_0_10_54_11]|uniref:Uncharacterized protein n=1 Tax=Candidatus Andersenbacteria bacterium CG10_big_fil_rev_8_21_14_0_10_54_11 TaxID=1974485 RepID=A0A2M6WYR1_9BACT|nr:MAG: hypothetical protein COT71_03295 [Candidatus Andersenbacteria bacterium CG10_big_fil_rev_8_21_14_0_10_54_11]